MSLYLADTWRFSRALQLTYGVRAEGSRFGKTPEFNPAVEQTFGYRTDEVPSDFQLSPRVGFTWTLGLPQQRPQAIAGQDARPAFQPGAFRAPSLIVRGGVGLFRSAPSTQLVAAAAGATGLPNNESQLICIGSAVPQANWSQYVTNPASAPRSVLSGQASTIPTQLPNVAVFGHDFAAPSAWRASLGAARPLMQRYNLNVELSYARGVAQTGYRDVNLRTGPRFTLTNEGDRPVFVDASTIVPLTGATSFLASRVEPTFGQVLVTSSDTRSDSKQLTVSFGGITTRGAIFNVAYTLARVEGSGKRLRLRALWWRRRLWRSWRRHDGRKPQHSRVGHQRFRAPAFVCHHGYVAIRTRPGSHGLRAHVVRGSLHAARECRHQRRRRTKRPRVSIRSERCGRSRRRGGDAAAPGIGA